MSKIFELLVPVVLLAMSIFGLIIVGAVIFESGISNFGGWIFLAVIFGLGWYSIWSLRTFRRKYRKKS